MTGRKRLACLQDLEDDHLLIIFSKLDPLPDLFSIAQCCKRFHRLASGGDLFLRVGYAHHNVPGKRQLAHASVQEAVRQSRKGDTIVISPRQQHRLDSVTIHHPLRIVGGGERPEETVLTCLSDLMPGLDFRATGGVSNLSMSAGKSPCVEQCRGCLKIDRCILMGRPERGLEHLSSPVRFDPVSRCAGIGSTALSVPASALQTCLSVTETIFRGQSGMKAVDTGTSRSLIKNVRIVELGIDTLYWFTVSSNARSALEVERGRTGVARVQGVDQNRPSWAQHATELFPGIAGQRGSAELSRQSKHAAEVSSDPLGADEGLRVKARHWKARSAFGECAEAALHTTMTSHSLFVASFSHDLEWRHKALVHVCVVSI